MNGVQLIEQERKRQIEVERHTIESDAIHNDGRQMAIAAIAYASFAIADLETRKAVRNVTPFFWPGGWAIASWKPSATDDNAGRIRELTKAGALIAAEIDRLLHVDNEGAENAR